MKKFKKMKKRILSALMISCMCITILPQGAVTVAAAEKEWPGNPRQREWEGQEYLAWDCIFFGSYLQRDTNGDGIVDEKDEKLPIQWRVLSVDEKTGDAFLMATNTLDAQPYNNGSITQNVTWETCWLRTWLNDTFMDEAFSDEEKEAIIQTTVVNENNPEYNEEKYPNTSDSHTVGGNSTEDYIYIPSISEMTNPDYGLPYDFNSYAGKGGRQGCGLSTEYVDQKNDVGDYWWVRNPGQTQYMAALIAGGAGRYEGALAVQTFNVRPVLHLNLNIAEWETACPEDTYSCRGLHAYSEWEQGDIYGNGKLVHSRICTDETCRKVHGDQEVMESYYCSGGTESYTHGKICSTCGYEYTDPLEDGTSPTGTISIDKDQWDDVVSGATFERFYKESKDVTITATDGESGVASISYYLADRELTKEDLIDIESWQPTNADYKEEDEWKETDTVTVTIKPDTECILYAKIVDGMGNTTYLSTDGMVFDETAPKIEGVEDQGTYCAPQDISVKVTDKYLDSVTLNGKNVALSKDGISSTFALSKTEPSQIIEAADKAGNSTTVTVTVNEEHSFGEWDASIGENRSKTCENCGQKYTETDEERVKAAKEIVEEFLSSLSGTEDMKEEDLRQKVEEKLAKEGFGDVTVTVDEFHKTEATKESEGKIQGTVTLEKGKTKGTVNLDKSISNKGIVKKDTHSEDGAPEVDLPMDEKDLADAVLTETDRRAIENGKNISLLLTVENTTNTVSAADKQKVEEGASYYTVGQYLDINLIKMVDTDNPDEGTPITKTNAPIEIVITIPNDLKKENRTYAVVRLHNRETTLLEDLDGDPDTVTIATDRFSTYAMVYTEITDADRVTEAQKIVEKVLSDMAVTNDTTKESIQQAIDTALKEAGFSDVTATVGELTKKDATGEAEGSIVGTVTIKKGEKSGSISINKTIAKLPQDNTGNQGDDSTVTPPDSTVITPEQQEKNEFALNEGLKVAQKGKKINVSWGKVTEADGYQIYVQYCSKKFSSKPTKEVKSAKTTKVSVTKINGKKLNLKKNYKVYVTAYKLVNGKRVVLGKTITAHIVGQNNKAYTNVKQVKVSKSKYTLKIGRTAKIKARTVLVDKTKKQLSNAHAKEFRYKSTDTGVAVVSAKGKITAKGKGTCYIYVYARNGYARKVKVTVR